MCWISARSQDLVGGLPVPKCSLEGNRPQFSMALLQHCFRTYFSIVFRILDLLDICAGFLAPTFSG